MKKFITVIIAATLIIAAAMMLTSCSQWDTPYEKLDEAGNDVSVKFDVGDGMFAGATTDVYVIDVFDYEDFKQNSDGKYEIPLVTPDSTKRGDSAFEVSRTGYFLAGWYTSRELRVNDSGEALDDFGELTSVSGKPQGYVYSGKWDFETDKLTVDPNEEHSSETPLVTLYAAWIPYYNFEFYTDNTAEPYATLTTKELKIPQWNNGALAMKSFPKLENKTLTGVYLDSALTEEVTNSITGEVDMDKGISLTPTIKVYTTWKSGNWFRIDNMDQFLDNASMDGSYELNCDLDFTDEIWPRAFSNGNFSGSIVGNGHKISNVTVDQTNVNQIYCGLFGTVTESASFKDVSFENITFNLRMGSRFTGSAFGLFAGSVAEGAGFENVSISGTFAVYPEVNVNNAGCSYGLLVGTGNNPAGLSFSNITYAKMDDGAIVNQLEITVDGETGAVTLKKTEDSNS